MSLVIGLYQDLKTAEDAVSELEGNGFSRRDMHLATYDKRAQRQQGGGFFDSLADLFGSKPQKVRDGDQGMIEHLTGWGVPEPEARHYVDALHGGSTLVLVNSPREKAPQAKEIMDGFGPMDVDSLGGQQQSDQEYTDRSTRQARMDTERRAGAPAGEGEKRIPIVEEDLRVGKRAVQRGGVRVHQMVTEKPVEQTHNVRDETVNVERRDVNREATPADLDSAFQEQTYEMSETDEELITDKQARVTGEVVMRKDVEERPETVRDTVRRTEVRTDDLSNRGRQDFATFDSDFRNNYDLVYANRGHDYNYYEPGYRYGYDLADSDRYSGRKWSEIEPEVQRDWERTHPQSKWQDFKDSIRFAWERASAGGTQDTGAEDTGTWRSQGSDYQAGMGRNG